MRDEALFINGVQQSVLQEIIETRQRRVHGVSDKRGEESASA